MSQLPLHSYQERGIQTVLLDERKFLAVDMGLGKTRICIEAIKKYGEQALVVAPLRVACTTWPDEIEKWAPELSYGVIHGPDKLDIAKRETDIQIINYEGLKWMYQKMFDRKIPRREWPFLVLDESSMIKSQRAQRFKILKSLVNFFPGVRVNLSATPMPNGYHELWSQCFMLDEGEALGKTFSRFVSRYFHYTGPPRYELLLMKGADKEIEQAVAHLFFRLEAEDYLEMPELIPVDIKFDLPPKVLKQYEELRKEAYLEIEDLTSISAVSAGVLCNKLRQVSQGALYTEDKEDYIVLHDKRIQLLKEVQKENEGSNILVACQYRFELDMLRKAFGDIPIIAGGSSAVASAEYLRQWNQNKIPLMVCHPASLSHGVNLQTGGNIIFFYGTPWSLEQYIQLTGRLRRQGQKNAVTVFHAIANNTVDARITKALNTKGQTQAGFLRAIKQALKEG